MGTREQGEKAGERAVLGGIMTSSLGWGAAANASATVLRRSNVIVRHPRARQVPANFVEADRAVIKNWRGHQTESRCNMIS